MKKFTVISVCAVALMLIASAVSRPVLADTIHVGDTITLNWGQPTHNLSGGGPFLLTDITTGDSFLSFCLEKNEYFTPGQNLKVSTISDAAVSGGVRGGNPDPISQETAWLYLHFREGDLWTITGTSLATDIFNLQDAIWMLEQELDKSNSNPFIQFLANHPTITSPSDLNYVAVINPVTYNPNGSIATYNQSQLSLRPVPEPGSLALLATGILGLGFCFKRKKS